MSRRILLLFPILILLLGSCSSTKFLSRIQTPAFIAKDVSSDRTKIWVIFELPKKQPITRRNLGVMGLLAGILNSGPADRNEKEYRDFLISNNATIEFYPSRIGLISYIDCSNDFFSNCLEISRQSLIKPRFSDPVVTRILQNMLLSRKDAVKNTSAEFHRMSLMYTFDFSRPTLDGNGMYSSIKYLSLRKAEQFYKNFINFKRTSLYGISSLSGSNVLSQINNSFYSEIFGEFKPNLNRKITLKETLTDSVSLNNFKDKSSSKELIALTINKVYLESTNSKKEVSVNNLSLDLSESLLSLLVEEFHKSIEDANISYHNWSQLGFPAFTFIISFNRKMTDNDLLKIKKIINNLDISKFFEITGKEIAIKSSDDSIAINQKLNFPEKIKGKIYSDYFNTLPKSSSIINKEIVRSLKFNKASFSITQVLSKSNRKNLSKWISKNLVKVKSLTQIDLN